MIDLTVDETQLARTIKRARERGIIIPTFKQQRDPSQTPDSIKGKLKKIGLWDISPFNLFRITWKNEPVSFGGGFNGVNYLELPRSLTGVPARIISLVGKWMPTGSHKVGATFDYRTVRPYLSESRLAFYRQLLSRWGLHCDAVGE